MDLAAEYDNRARVPEHPAIIAGWKAGAEAFRQRAQGEFDLAYGGRPRCRVDVFHPAGQPMAPLLLFIHGGYWRAFDKSMFSHLAAGVNAHGLSMAVAGYTLCPEVAVADIIAELRQCCLYLWHRYGWPLVVAGHSAGAHLAACLAATRWEDYGAPSELVRAGFGVSGVYDLRPLLAVPVNDDLRLDGASALAASPLFWPVPRQLPFHLLVGGAESSEFIRQSRSLAAAWTGLGLAAPCAELPGENHFGIISHLADPESPMTRHLAALATA